MGEEGGRTTVVLVVCETLRECQEKVMQFVRSIPPALARHMTHAVVSRHPRQPLCNVGDLGCPELTGATKRYNLLMTDSRLYGQVTISEAQWHSFLAYAGTQDVTYLFWMIAQPVGDWSPVSPPVNLVPRDCWPPTDAQLWRLHLTAHDDRVDIALTQDVVLPPRETPAFTPKPMQLPQARQGKSDWRTPRVSGTQSVTDVAKRAASTGKHAKNKGNSEKSL